MSELYHHGIKGQRWGVRRYQNKDGTLTNAGKKRYSQIVNEIDGNLDRTFADAEKKYYGSKEIDNLRAKTRKAIESVDHDPKYMTDIERQLEKKRADALQKSKNGKSFRVKREGKKELRNINKQLTEAYKKLANDPEWLRFEDKKADAQMKIFDKYKYKLASQLMRELGYEDTRRVKELVKTAFIDRFTNDFNI